MKSPFRSFAQSLAVTCVLACPGATQITGTGSRTAAPAPGGTITVLPNTPGGDTALAPTADKLTTLAGAMNLTQDPQVLIGINNASVSPAPMAAAPVKKLPTAAAKDEGTVHAFIKTLSEKAGQIEKSPEQSGHVIEQLYTGAKDAAEMTEIPIDRQMSSMAPRLHRARPTRNMRLLPGASAFTAPHIITAPAKESWLSIPVAAVIAVMTAVLLIAMAAAVLAGGPAAAVGAAAAPLTALAILAKIGLAMPMGAVIGGAVGMALGIKLRSTTGASIGTGLGIAAGVSALALLSAGLIGAAILLLMISLGAVLGFGQNSLDQDEGTDGFKNKPQWREPAFWIASAIAAGAIGMLGFSSIVAALGAILAMFTFSLLAKYSSLKSLFGDAKDSQ